MGEETRKCTKIANVLDERMENKKRPKEVSRLKVKEGERERLH